MDISKLKDNIEDNTIVLENELREMGKEIDKLEKKRKRLSSIVEILQGNVMKIENKLEEVY